MIPREFKIQHVMYVKTTNGWTQQSQEIDYHQYDGDWYFVNIFVDQGLESIIISYYSHFQQLIYQNNIQGQLILSEKMMSVTGGSITLDINEPIRLFSYLGQIMQTIVTSENLFDEIDDIRENCSPQQYCYTHNEVVVGSNIQFTSQIYMSPYYKIAHNIYTLQGWIKQDSYYKKTQLDSFLLRITINRQNLDESQIGDRLLYILYYQSWNLNGFSLQTYSYDFPYKPEIYQGDSLDTIHILNEKYLELLTKWHYFSYQVGTNTNDGQPQYSVYFPNLGTTEEFRWGKKINHFLNTHLYFFVGKDDFFSNQFQGYLSDWQFTYNCAPIDMEFTPLCHFTCLTCSGLFENDCLSCKENSNRIYSEQLKSCSCQIGYVDMDSSGYCQLLNLSSGIFELVEIDTSKEQNDCFFGYFQYYDQCVKCPFYEIQNNDYVFDCGDCILYPEIFNQTLNCTFQLNASEQYQTFHQTYYNYFDFYLFEITLTFEQGYQLLYLEGYENKNKCKENYVSTDGICKACPENCYFCDSVENCSFCRENYLLSVSGDCKPCTSCKKCGSNQGQEICEYPSMCNSDQFWKDSFCYPCGNHCQLCDEYRCLKCSESDSHFLSFDHFNCAKCPLSHCKQCFQYIYSDNNIITTLDLNFYVSNINYYEIKIGCALCYDNYFFSYITQQCEPSPSGMEDCQFGVIINNQQQSVCLISESRLDALQNNQCQGDYCISCINNYSQTIQLCIQCTFGYYTTFLTGQCKKCPFPCLTCAEQNTGYQDFWKQDIRAFYNYFVDSQKNHSFEKYASNIVMEFEIICLSCPKTKLLHENYCYEGCDDNCLDCRPIFVPDSEDDQETYIKYIPKCFQCKDSQFQLQRSVDPLNFQNCLTCAEFCNACHPRLQVLNPFFDKSSEYVKYSHICYSYNENFNLNINKIPNLMIPNPCSQFQNCKNTLLREYYVYCDVFSSYLDQWEEQEEIKKEKYIFLYSLIVNELYNEKESLFSYLNQMSVVELNLEMQLRYYTGDNNCELFYKQQNITGTKFHEKVFALNQLNLKIYNTKPLKTPFLFLKQFTIQDFESVSFNNIEIYMPYLIYNGVKYSAEIYVLNQYNPIAINILNCDFVQKNPETRQQFSIMSNMSKTINIESLNMKQLNIENSIIFNFQPLSENIGTFTVKHLNIINSTFANTSIFYFAPIHNSFNFKIDLNDIFITNTIFQSSFFINSTFQFDYDVGHISFQNFHLQNVIFSDQSIFVFMMSARSFEVQNFTITNVTFSDQSSLFICNVFSLQQINLLNSIISQGFLISNQGIFSASKIVLENSKRINLSQITFKNITCQIANSLIYLGEAQVQQINITCFDLTIDNNNYFNNVKGQFAFPEVSFLSSLLYIECSFGSFQKITITRGIGLPELSILNSGILILNNLSITNSQNLKLFHSSFDCVKQFIHLNFPFVLYVKFQNLQLEDFNVENILAINSPLIILYNDVSDHMNQVQIFNSKFTDNVLITTNNDGITSIISIESKYSLTISTFSLIMQNNHCNKYAQNTIQPSSSTLLINAPSGKVTFYQSQFIQNVITNSSDSVLYVESSTLIIQECQFSNQNYISLQKFFRNLLFFNQTLTKEDIQNIFNIYSKGGNGNFQIDQLEIRNTSVVNSLAADGGGFYITTLQNGTILIKDSHFMNCSTTIDLNSYQAGGVLYIDSSFGSLDFQISNSSFYQSYSRTYGGAIFIVPSRIKNSLNYSFLNVSETFSLSHSFLSFTPEKQIQVQSNIIIDNSRFSNSQDAFFRFAAKIQDLSSQNIQDFQINNPLIFVQYSNFTVQYCKFENIHLTNLIEITDGININILKSQIFNCTYFNSPLLNINLLAGNNSIIFLETKGIINIQDTIFTHLEQFTLNRQLKCLVKSTTYNDLLCPQEVQAISDQIILANSNQNETINLECNLIQFFSKVKSNFSLIQIQNLEKNHFIFVSNIQMNSIQCFNCSYGLFSIQSFQNTKSNIQLYNIRIHDNYCGFIGCLSMIQSLNDIESALLIQQYDTSSRSELQLSDFQAFLTNGVFTNNTSNYGGACFFTNLDIYVDESLFLENQATIQGGAIHYYSTNFQLLIQNSYVIKNSAQIAGGLFMNGDQLENRQNFNLFLQDNNAVYFADNLFEQPRKMHLKISSNQSLENVNILTNFTTKIEQIKLTSSNSSLDFLLLPSGTSISNYQFFDTQKNSYQPFNFQFRIQGFNIFDEQISNLEQSICTISAQEITKDEDYKLQYQEIIKFNSSNQYLSQNSYTFSDKTQDYNLDDLIIYFNPYSDSDQYLQLAFQFDAIKIPYYNSSNFIQPSNIITNYILLLNIRTFECQLGEYFNQTSGACTQCDSFQFQYSVTINSTRCSYMNELTTEEILPAMIKLRKSYWRPYYYSEKIENCFHLPANCEGGWISGSTSCAIGHIGALCEQCDLYNIRGNGSYSSNQAYQCSQCDQENQNILNIIFVICWTLISILITVTTTIRMIEDLIFQLKLRPLRFYIIIQSASTSVLIKVFTNYLQIISSISSFQLNLPIGLMLAIRGVGNPIQSMAFSLDCYLKQIDSIAIIYLRVINGFVTVGIYISIFFLAHLIISLIKKDKINLTFITTTFIYIYIYLSPNIVSELSFLISFRNISNEKWIAANVAYLYNTEIHYKWLIYFVSPAFCIVGILLPIFFWFIVYHHRQVLDDVKVRRTWGYLYNEYKLTRYYWETIKIVQKELIILVLIYYEDYVTIKACLIFFLLHLYSKLTDKFKPYQTGNLNNIDSLSTSVCKISIVMAQFLYQAQVLNLQEIIWPFYLLLAIINFLFIFQMLEKLLVAYFDKFYSLIDQMKIIFSYTFPRLVKKYPLCTKLMSSSSERKFIIRKRYQKLRVFLIQQAKLILELKQQIIYLNRNSQQKQNQPKNDTYNGFHFLTDSINPLNQLIKEKQKMENNN